MSNRTISLRYGNLYLVTLPNGRMRVHFVNHDATFDNPEDALFLYASIVEKQLLDKLEQANQCYHRNLYARWHHKLFYVTTLYCSEESKRIQLKITLKVFAWEGELHIRLCQCSRQRFLTDEGQLMLSAWQPTYSSFRFHVNDLETLKDQFTSHSDSPWNDYHHVDELVEGLQDVCL